jgi:hypothetical protein
LTHNWADADAAAALAWVESLPSGFNAARDNAKRTALTVYANLEPAAAWTYAKQTSWDTNTPDDGSNGIRTKTMANISVVWSTQDPAAAATHLMSLPTGSAVNNAIPAVATNWLRQDPEAASAWIDTLPAGSARDNAVVQLISTEGKNNLPAAYKWAESLKNTSLQTAAVNAVVQEWAKKDPAAVTSVVQAGSSTETRRTELLTLITKNAPTSTTPAPASATGGSVP